MAIQIGIEVMLKTKSTNENRNFQTNTQTNGTILIVISVTSHQFCSHVLEIHNPSKKKRGKETKCQMNVPERKMGQQQKPWLLLLLKHFTFKMPMVNTLRNR